MPEMNSPNPPDQAADEARPRQADAMPSPGAAGHAVPARKLRRLRIVLALAALLLLWGGAEVWRRGERRQDEAIDHYNLGNAKADKGDLDGAIACYKQALELDPEFAPAYHNLGGVLYDKGDLDGAIASYKKALERDSKYAPAHYNLGDALKDKGDLDGAIACFHKAGIGFLGQPMGKALHIKLRSAYEAWSESRDDKTLVSEVASLAERFGKEKPVQPQASRLGKENLELICFEYVSS
jgi:tetratricopeptide (TPR) repeat protein